MSVQNESCNSTTDVIASNRNLDPGNLGVTSCFDYVDEDAHICARARMQIDIAEIQLYANAGIAQTACHEIGHSVGLQHYNTAGILAPNGESDCMRSGAVPSEADTWHTYGNHHKSHINDYY